MFELVNPVIIGSFRVKYNESSAIDAAKKFWNEFSKLLVNEVPKTYFSMRDENGKLFHFKVTEEESSSNLADFMISPVVNINPKASELVSSNYDKMISQSGGRHRHHIDDPDDSPSDSDDSSESDSEMIERFEKINRMKRQQPIMYYHYIPSIYGADALFIPSFAYPNQAYVEIGFSTAFWG